MSSRVGFTIGPASWSKETFNAMIKYARLVRFPFAKETPAMHLERANSMRESARMVGEQIEIIADLPGGKPRLSNKNPISIDSSRTMRIRLYGTNEPFNLDVTPSLPETVWENLPVSAAIGDGEIEFLIEKFDHGVAVGMFKQSGTLERRLAFTLPGVVPASATETPADREYIESISSGPFDWLALSFVQGGAEIRKLRKDLESKYNWRPKLMPKIETTAAVENIYDICSAAEGVMLARGDLALQVGLDGLLDAEKRVLRACNESGILAVAATGFLESMRDAQRPTRSEVVDLQLAYSLGADVVMFTGETTVGTDPIEVVKMANLLGPARSGS